MVACCSPSHGGDCPVCARDRLQVLEITGLECRVDLEISTARLDRTKNGTPRGSEGDSGYVTLAPRFGIDEEPSEELSS